MRITIDARFYGLENAGLGRYTINLLQQLQKIDSKNSYSVLLRKKYFSKLNLKKNFAKVLADISHYSVAEQIKLPRIIAKTNPDIVHYLHFNVPISYRSKYMVTIHDLLMHKSTGRDATTLPMFLYHFKRIGYKTAFRHAIKDSKHLIVPSRFVKSELIQTYPIPESKVSVVYEGVSVEKFVNKSERKFPYFIYTGNAYPHKNLKRAIEAVISLNRHSKTKVELLIVCSRSIFTKRLEAMIKTKNAEKYVHFLGFIEDKKLHSLYRNSLGFLYPSLSEGFGLPALEAMKSGTVALVSDIPVFKEIYGKSAFYFDPFKVESITQTMKKVIELDPKLRIQKIKAGQKYTEKYSWEKMASQTLALYEKLAE